MLNCITIQLILCCVAVIFTIGSSCVFLVQALFMIGCEIFYFNGNLKMVLFFFSLFGAADGLFVGLTFFISFVSSLLLFLLLLNGLLLLAIPIPLVDLRAGQAQSLAQHVDIVVAPIFVDLEGALKNCDLILIQD